MKWGKKICPGSRFNATKNIGQENIKMHNLQIKIQNVSYIALWPK